MNIKPIVGGRVVSDPASQQEGHEFKPRPTPVFL